MSTEKVMTLKERYHQVLTENTALRNQLGDNRSKIAQLVADLARKAEEVADARAERDRFREHFGGPMREDGLIESRPFVLKERLDDAEQQVASLRRELEELRVARDKYFVDFHALRELFDLNPRAAYSRAEVAEQDAAALREVIEALLPGIDDHWLTLPEGKAAIALAARQAKPEGKHDA